MSSASSKHAAGERRRHTRKKPHGTLLSSCEPEIQELLRQVDLLLESKRCEWETRVTGLQKQLQRRDGELNALRAALQHRNTEVERLQARVDDAERDQEEQTRTYEVQLTTMKTELSRLSRKHEKLQTKKEQQMEDTERDRHKVSEEWKSANRELQHVRKAFEELHAKSMLWDKEKSALEKKTQQCVAESEAMRSRCVYLEECNTTYQRDLERYKRLQLNSEQTHKVHIAQLEAKLKLNQQESESREDSNSRIKSVLEETLLRLRQKSSECERLHSELASNNDALEKLKRENMRLQRELQQRDHQLRSLQRAQSKRTREMEELRESMQSKDDVIATLEEHGQKDNSPDTSPIRSELNRSQTTVRTLTARQKELMEELKRQQQLVVSYKQQCHSLKNQMSCKEESVHTSHAKLLELRDSEIRQLRSRTQDMDADRQSLLNDISRLQTESADREKKNAHLVSQIDAMERQIHSKQAAHNRHADDLKMANSQLEVLRRENQRLRDAADCSVLSNHDAAAEESLVEMNSQLQNATIAVLEDQNRRLQSKVLALEASLVRLKQERGSSTVRSVHVHQSFLAADSCESDLKGVTGEVHSGIGEAQLDGEQRVLPLADEKSFSEGLVVQQMGQIQVDLNQEKEVVPTATSDHDSNRSHTTSPSLRELVPELDISVSSHSQAAGSRPDSPLSPLSSGSQWSLGDLKTADSDDMEGLFQINELETILDARISEFQSGIDNVLDEFDQ